MRVASAAAVTSTVALTAVALSGCGGGAPAVGHGPGQPEAFNSCVRQTRFLVVVPHRSGTTVIELIKARGHSAVVGGFAALPSARAANLFPTANAGSGARNGRYVMFTTVALGRNASAIQDCFDRFFPPSPA